MIMARHRNHPLQSAARERLEQHPHRARAQGAESLAARFAVTFMSVARRVLGSFAFAVSSKPSEKSVPVSPLREFTQRAAVISPARQRPECLWQLTFIRRGNVTTQFKKVNTESKELFLIAAATLIRKSCAGIRFND